jgi:hypothetical protein
MSFSSSSCRPALQRLALAGLRTPLAKAVRAAERMNAQRSTEVDPRITDPGGGVVT